MLSGASSPARAQPNERRGGGQGGQVSEAEAPLVPLLGIGEEVVGGVKTSAARSARLLPYVEMLAREEKTAAQVWASGKFSVEDVLFALEYLITSNGVLVGRKGSPQVR